MNAREIQTALDGVAAECLDPNLIYVEKQRPQGWYDGDCYIAPSHAAKIQEASMVEWLSAHKSVCISGTTIRVGSTITPVDEWDDYTAPTRLEALAKACKAMKEQSNGTN